MKKIVYIIFLLIAFSNIQAQVLTTVGSNIGIGTTDPKQTLTVDRKQPNINSGVPATNGQNQNGIMRLQVNGDTWGEVMDFGMNVTPSYGWIQATNRTNLGVNYNLALNPNGGNVGIGTTTPAAKLDVGAFIDGGQTGTIFGRLAEGNGTGDGTYLGVNGYETQTGPYNLKSFAIEHHFYGHTNSSINFYRGGGTTGGFITFNTNDNTERMRIDGTGNVGIGTTPNALYKLDVKGALRATEVKIESIDNFADFVFEKNYKLPKLSEVNNFIQKNGHLQNIPSATEVKDNGMSLVEMQVKLLQKVEELTLYAIEQQKKIEELEKKLK